MLKSRFLLISLVFLLIGGLTVFAQDADADKAAKKAAKEAKKAAKKAEKEAKKAGEEVDEAVSDGDGDDGFNIKRHDEYPYPSVRDREYIDYVRPKKKDQQDAFIERKYTHPSPPKNQWELGIDLGVLHVSGDVKAKGLFPGFGIGGHIRKSFGYVFSLRGNFMTGTTFGEDWQAKTRPVEDTENPALNGNRRYETFNTSFNEVVVTPDYNGKVFHNYKTKINELSLSGVVNLNNIKFHKRRNLFAWYGLFGIGGFVYNTTMDQLDGDGNTYTDLYNSIGVYNNEESRRDRLDDLRDGTDGISGRDGTYESQAEVHWDDYWIFGSKRDGDHVWNYRPTAHVGLGTAIKISRRINIGLESKVTYTNDDLLDGDRWTEWGALSRDYDTYVFTNASININLGGKNTVEPLWWMNPLDYSYDELDNAPCCDDLPPIPDLTDSDGDGVPDMFDDEADSRKDCPVNTRGVMLDTDGDGILDCDDCQPLTPKHLIDKISDCGEALEENCCDELREEIEKLKPGPCDDSMLPNILFKENCYGVNDNFRPQLQTVASYLNDPKNSKVSLCVVGNVDGAGAYNEVLAWKRANEVKNILMTEFGVNPNQLKVQYQPGASYGGGGGFGGKKKGIGAEQALNRRVDFKCCENGFDMPRPNGPDAGRKCK